MDGTESSGVTVQFFPRLVRGSQRNKNGMKKCTRNSVVCQGRSRISNQHNWNIRKETYSRRSGFFSSCDFFLSVLSPDDIRKGERSFIEAIKCAISTNLNTGRRYLKQRLVARETAKWKRRQKACAIYVADFYAILRTVGRSKIARNSRFQAGIFQEL